MDVQDLKFENSQSIPDSNTPITGRPQNKRQLNVQVQFSGDDEDEPKTKVASMPPPQSLPSTKSSKILRIGNFRLGKTIGEGSFGKVKIAEHIITGHKVAVKVLNRKKIKSLRMDLKIRREISNMKLFRHPHIIRLYEVIETPTDIFMVIEYVSGGELFDYIVSHGKLSEDDARKFFQQIISGVEYCHNHMVVHRDLKPENLLIDQKNHSVKIADFGLSTMMQDGDFLKTSCGSPNYAAPEVISGKLYAGPEVDVWSCGVILYTLLCARLPFDDEYIPSLFKKIRAGKFDMPPHISAPCKDLLKSMLETDPLKRITISEIRGHQWFQVNLPRYLMYSPQTTHIVDNVDKEIVQEITQKFATDTATVLEALERGEKNGEMNEFLVAYNLIYDNKRIYLNSEPLMPTPALSSVALFSSSPPVNLRDEMPFDVEDEVDANFNEVVYSNSLNTSNTSNPGSLQNSTTGVPSSPSTEHAKPTKRKMWSLGIVSSNLPTEIMKEVFRALKATGFEWKVIGPFQLRCRYKENIPQTTGRHVKLALQLYKVKEKKYLLDIKKLEGETFPFFDITVLFLSELRL